jgi:hypothetical protein
MTTTTARRLPWIRLTIIWLIGTCAVAACFGITVTLLDDKPLSGLLTGLFGGEGSTGLALGASAGALACVGRLCWYRWRRGSTNFHYLGAVGLGLLGCLAFWAVVSVVGAVASGSLSNLFLLFAVSVFGAFLNLVNLLVVVPQIIWFWHRTVGHTTSAPKISHMRRYIVLGWIAVACVPVYLDARVRKRHRTITAVDYDMGADVDKWLDQLGESNFEALLGDDEDAGSMVYAMKQFIPVEIPFTFTRKGLEVRWTNVFEFSVYASAEHSADRGIRKAVCKYGSLFDTHEQARALVQDTVRQFRRGSWQPALSADDKDHIDEDTAREMQAGEWLALMQRDKPLRWRWQDDGVLAMLHASLYSGDLAAAKPSYSITLEFRQASIP